MPPPAPIRMYVSAYVPQPDFLQNDAERAPLYDHENPAAEPLVHQAAIEEMHRINRNLEARASQAQALREVQMVDVDEGEDAHLNKEIEQPRAGGLSTVTRKRPRTKALPTRALRSYQSQWAQNVPRQSDAYSRLKFSNELSPEMSLFDDLGREGTTSLLEEVHYPRSGSEGIEVEEDIDTYSADHFEEPADREYEDKLMDNDYQTDTHENYHTAGPGYHSFASALGSFDITRVKPLKKRPSTKHGRPQAGPVFQRGKKRRISEDENVPVTPYTQSTNAVSTVSGWQATLPHIHRHPPGQPGSPQERERKRGRKE